MAQMLQMMPKIWRVYKRVWGIALSRDRFQFIFELETDLLMVIKFGFWTFDDWGMVMDRWVENPHATFLKKVPVWIRIYKIPGNHLTLKTFDTIANRISHVTNIAYDPAKPLLQEYIRVLVDLDVEQPVRDNKTVNLPRRGVAVVEIEYKRVRKKCFHCLRLTHEKQRCPALQPQRHRANAESSRARKQSFGQRQHHNKLSEKLLPMLAPAAPPSFAPMVNLVAPSVFEQI